MNARDELAELIGEEWEPAEIVAERILDHGYTKPRTITTAEELDALPVGSVILTSAPRVAAKVAFRNNESEWFTPDASEWFSSDELDDLPVTVSYEPTP